MNLPVWKSKKDGELIQFELSLRSFLLVILPKNQAQSAAAHFQESDVGLISLENVKRWIEQIVQDPNHGVQFRVIGDLTVSNPITSLLIRIGLTEGKHYSSEGRSALEVHFLPQDGRIRVPKETERNELSAPISLNQKKQFKVLVVDDSETIRKILKKIIDSDPSLTCIEAVDLPSKVIPAIERYRPDVITLDIHMPEMNGVELLKLIRKKYQIPILMISSLSKEEGGYVLDALESGAVDYIQKPSMNEIAAIAPTICEKIRIAAIAPIFQMNYSQRSVKLSSEGVDFSYLIGIGSSTGGTEALKKVLTELPEEIPPIVIVQHIPAGFSKAFAERMNQICSFEVREAEDGDQIKKSQVLIAPGGKQMELKSVGSEIKVVLSQASPNHRHNPSVDVLFNSIAELNLKKVTTAILTGMGSDGAKGMLKLRKMGARTIAQNEATCVVYGMPKEAVAIGAAEQVLPLDKIAQELLKCCKLKKVS